MFLSGADNNLKVYVCADIAASSEKVWQYFLRI